MRRPLLLVIITAIAYSQSEIMSPDTTKGVLFPLLFVFSLLSLLIWFARRFDRNRKHDFNPDDGGNAYFLSGKNSDGDLGDGGTNALTQPHNSIHSTKLFSSGIRLNDGL